MKIYWIRIVKASFFLMFFCLYNVSAYADRCVFNNEDIIEAAVLHLQKTENAVYYCPTCEGDNHVRYMKIAEVKILHDGTEQKIQINNNDIDLAYTYLPTEKANIYHNLGYMVHCADLDNSPVLEYLDVKAPYGIENLENLAKQLAVCSTKTCEKQIYQDILDNYFEANSDILKGFLYKKVTLPQIITKESVADLLAEIAAYYGNGR